MSNRREYVQGLREYADFVEQHPEFPLSNGTFYLFVTTRDEFLRLRKMLGHCVKEFLDTWIVFERKFGPHAVRLNIACKNICERVLRKKFVPARDQYVIPAMPEHEVDVIEWNCPESLLAEDKAPEE